MTKTKTTTITTAEKRVIKSEISSLKKACAKVQKDCVAETLKLNRESAKIERRKKQIGVIYNRETAKICRRIAILEGRL